MDIKEVIEKSLGYKPLDSYKLIYDAPDAHLESIYFWVLDFLEDLSDKKEGLIKVTDNFTSSPGSGHFSDIGMKSAKLQEEAMKMLGAVNQLVKAVLNLLYDLKEFEIRLKHYDLAESKDAKEKEAGMLALKQIWMDNVDVKKGRGSLNQMSFELGFSTIRDAFIMANSVEEVNKMAGEEGLVNDQIKRILIPRISEFLIWKEQSQKELKKRFEIEKSYLKSQVETLKLYSSWVRPYLKSIEDLKMKGFNNNPSLVAAFNTVLFELVLFSKSTVKIEKAVFEKKLPKSFQDYKPKRDYHGCVIVNFKFRGFPQKVSQQNYGFGGEVTMNFDAYALNEEEWSLIKKEMEKKDIEDGLKIATETSEVALDQLREDIEHFLDEKFEAKKKEEKKDNLNPFAAIWDLIFKKEEKKKDKKKIEKPEDIKKDDYVEKELRKLAEEGAKKSMFTVYDVYKKAHLMASSPEPFDSFQSP